MPKVSRPTEEAREEIEGVVALARAVALLMLLDTFVAILIVDLAGFLNAEDVVGFGDCDKLLACSLVSTDMY